MFSFRALALLAIPLLAHAAYTIDTPTEWLANTTVTISWNSLTSDPELFSAFLVNPELLPTGPIGIADTISADDLTYDIPLPRVPPGGGYFVRFTNPGNINDIYADSGFFPIIQNDVDGSSSGPGASSSTTSRSTGTADTDSTTSTRGTTSSGSSTRSTGTVNSNTQTTDDAAPSQFGSGGGAAGSFTTPSTIVSISLAALFASYFACN